jgi:predicted membrane-bound spermidine synthase
MIELSNAELNFLMPESKNYSTKYNGILEVVRSGGKKYLDSANANYSYGSLQEIFLTILDTLMFENDVFQKAERILLLGLGGGCVVEMLRNHYKTKAEIWAVEIDEAVICIAENEFGIKGGEKLHIICADAEEFIASETSQYDIILVDIFLDSTVPPQFLRREFFVQLSLRLKTGGKIVFNRGFNRLDMASMEDLEKNPPAEMQIEMSEKVCGCSYFLVGERLGKRRNDA